MDKIYVLVTGVYSDWMIHGFAETEEEAIKNCAVYNEKYDEDMYYVEVNKFNEHSKEELDSVPSSYICYFYAWHTKEGWSITNGWNLGNATVHFKANTSNVKSEVVVNKIPRYRREVVSNYKNVTDYEAEIYVALSTPDYDKALKIAQDMLYKKLAEREGI